MNPSDFDAVLDAEQSRHKRRVLACPARWARQALTRALHQPPLIQALDVERVPAAQHSARFPLCKVVQADHAHLSREALRRRAEPLEVLPTVVAVMCCRSGIDSPVSRQMANAALAEIPPQKQAAMIAAAAQVVKAGAGNDEGAKHREQRRDEPNDVFNLLSALRPRHTDDGLR
eukprot:CAMPEP_0203970860 /NCGR_PEP_ID=MMETSP0359-20131031/98181_1 /ASSEMBLY_ACC=CAM_ASM_000338 /TAXON_ID=268821 /ORGANISM="Scrippsiella Hangoei, Strain SHTV-5" /LENGTH=173 /DNA_ID=CAMNT_0050908821 /DNA_START=94 /DNA_END=616 /DNA_ORIENTATION=+